MLRVGGVINIIISFAHLIGLIWAKQMFEVTGIGKEMSELSQTNATLPYLLTIFVAIVFFIFGLYGLSADGKFRKLPLLKTAIFVIAGIYLFRGIGEIIADKIQGTNSTTETIYSLVAIGIGLLFFIGGLRKWTLKKE